LANPKFSAGEKAIMVGYELSTAGVGVCIAYGLANVWNPTGWVALLVPVGYTAVTFFAGGALQTWLEEN